MPVNLSAPNPSDLHPVPGVKLGITMAGVRKANRRDLTVITLDEGSAVAGVFTKSKCPSAPVDFCRQNLAHGVARGILLAFWAFETDFGKNMGDFETIPSLATLAWEGRRRELFANEFCSSDIITRPGTRTAV